MAAIARQHQAPPQDTSDERLLIARVCARDLRAFEQLYRLYHPRLTRFLMRMTRRPPLVDEVVNDTMLVVWSRPEAYSGTSRLSSWIFAIAYRKALKALRRQDVPIQPAVDDERPSGDDGPEVEAGRGRARASLLDLLDALSPEHRAVIELTYFHDFGYRDIAEIVDCPVDTVKTRMFYARRHLGRLIPGTLGDWL